MREYDDPFGHGEDGSANAALEVLREIAVGIRRGADAMERIAKALEKSEPAAPQDNGLCNNILGVGLLGPLRCIKARAHQGVCSAMLSDLARSI